MKKLELFQKALDNLRLIENYAPPYDVVTETGLVNLFSICFEQAWKAMKEILEEHGFDKSRTGSPRMIIKLAYQAGMIKEEEGWLNLMDARNEVSHSYNEDVALSIIKKSKEQYVSLFEELEKEMAERWL